MGLVVINNKFRIKLANDDFFHSLTKYSSRSIQGKAQFNLIKDNKLEYFDKNVDIHFFKSLEYWFSYLKVLDRLIYVFGTNEPEEYESNIPFLQIEFTISGINQDSRAVFAQDKHGKVSVLYRVNHEHLNPNSFELEFEGEWIQAEENGKNNYFMLMGELNNPNFMETFQNFLRYNRKNISSNDISKVKSSTNSEIKPKICKICGKEISSVKSDYDSIIQELNIDNSNCCVNCIEKMAAAAVVKKINDIINVKIFNKISLLKKVDNPNLYESYLNFLLELGYLKELNNNLLTFNRSKNLNQLLNNSNEETLIEEKNKKENKCIKCGVILTSDNCFKLGSDALPNICKDCSRKSYAVKALNHLEEYVEPGVPFNKDDLFKLVDKTRFLDYIWTLEEFDLLERDKNDFYILKPEEELDNFRQRYGENIQESEKETPKITQKSEKKKSEKVIKECEICHKKLPISNFYKSDDGYSDKCKACSRKSYAAKALIEIKKYVRPKVEFFKEDLLKQVDNRTQLLDYFWTLQDFDFITHNEKNDTYTLKSEDEINSFIEKYGQRTITTTTEEEPEDEKAMKTVKECKTCKQVLPVSKFYKSSLSDDGYTENCKDCSDKLNVVKILLEIKKSMGIGIPFSKKDLSSQLKNPTKVDYYIWTLQEHDLIDYNDTFDTYIIRDNEKYQEYTAFIEKDNVEEPSTPPSEVTANVKPEEDSLIKDIIYISEVSEDSRTVVLRVLVENDKLYPILEEIKDIVTSNMTNMNFDRYKEDLIKIIIELEIENEKYDECLNYLKDNNWRKF